jgi:hypothetical protein
MVSPEHDADTGAHVSEDSFEVMLLRRYEPVLAFTEGEMFFPTSAEQYVERASLISIDGDGARHTLVERGNLGLELLAEIGASGADEQLSLQFVDEPMRGPTLRRWLATKPRFEAKGSLARTGLLGRFADATDQMTLVMRGRTLGGTAAKAQVLYAAMRDQDQRDFYYGRALRRGAYIVLHYLFFYAMNDWRSSFFGVNDHEADWKQVFVYLYQHPDGSLEPTWLACGSDDYAGADLRRRWDDRDLSFRDGHAVVWVGAGSHACYFRAGDYVINVPSRLSKAKTTGALWHLWRNSPEQGDHEAPASRARGATGVPYVDYARGDGMQIGPGEERCWSPILIGDGQPWVNDYRGAWGMDVGDFFGGEGAPAGPKYNRDGSVRQSWADPISWVGLDNEPHPSTLEQDLARRIRGMEAEADEVASRAAVVRDRLSQLSVEVLGIEGLTGFKELSRRRSNQIAQLETSLKDLIGEEAELRSAVVACENLQARAHAGYRPGPRDHIRHAQEPALAGVFREGRVAEYSAAVIAGFLLVLLGIAYFVGAPFFTGIVLAVIGFLLVDTVLSGTGVRFLVWATLTLAIVTTALLIYQFFWSIAFFATALAGVLLLGRNLREVRFSFHRG